MHQLPSFTVQELPATTLQQLFPHQNPSVSIMLSHTRIALVARCPQRLPKWHQKRARLSSSVETSLETASSESPSSLFHFQEVTRYGPGDGILTINVGGKEFKTLQSTIHASPILCETIDKAMANGEFTEKKAIFVDRDPTHFPLILTYLRNKAEGIAYNDKTIKKTMAMGMTKYVPKKKTIHPKYVRLPDNQGELQDLYAEAVHYGLEDLQHQLCHTSFMVTVASWFGGGGNPFLQANEALKGMRRTLFAFAGTTSIVAAMRAEVNWVKKQLGLPVDEGEDVVGEGNKSGGEVAPA